jgi:hypothetical protein
MHFAERETVLELARPAMVIVALTLVEALPSVLHAKYGLDEHFSKIAIGVAAIVVLVLLDWLIRRASQFGFIRRRRYPVAWLEGIWLQNVDRTDRPYSIARIAYIGNGRWKYDGVGYTAQFTPAAHWTTFSLTPSSDGRSWYFFGEFHQLRFNKPLNHYERQKGGEVAPILNLPEKDLSKATRLDGHVADLEIGTQRSPPFTIVLYRATSESVPADLLSGPEGFKRLTADQCRKLFSDNNVPLASS